VEEAARAAVQGLAAVPHDPGLARAVATLVPARAGEVLAAGVRHTPDDAPLQTAWATWLLQEGEVERAAQAAATSLSIDPTDKEARRIAMLAADIGGGRLTLEQAVRAEAALGDGAALDALVAAAPSSVVVRLLRAATHREAGENDDALRHLQAALKVDPTHGEASAAAGQLLLQKGDAHAAVPLLEQAVQGAPHDEALRITWATALQQAGLRSKALGVMAQLAEERPLNVVVQGAYAQALVDAGQSEQAYVALRDALRVLPDPRLTAAFVMVAAESGHRQEAAALLDQLAKASGSEALAAKAEALRQP
jgi:predicted Zn-dependent protease